MIFHGMNGIPSKPWDSAQISARVFFLEGYHRPAAIKYDPKDIPLGALGFYGIFLWFNDEN